MTPAKLVASLPESIRVGPYDVALRVVDKTDALVMEAGGYFEFDSLTIGIRGEQPSTHRAADVLIHEVSHAIWWTSGLQDKDDEERTISLLSTGWAQVYRANPWLLKWLAKALA